VSFLIAELIELHDRSRFEVFGISFGRDDGSSMRARLAAAFDHFLDVRSKSDTEVAELMRALEIDIAIDLTGYTKGCRPGIFARRAAPIQVSYLGFPATMGADFIDYIIADRIVLPFDQQQFYSERIVHLPDSFQVNDSRRRIAEHTPSRSDLKLPEEGFVLCCFNNSYKITPDIFDIWMRLLKQINGSVMWLLGDNAGLRNNLAQEAERRGVAASRLVFGPHLPLDEHLARYRMADLFLDTSPCSAGTTASDALWAGLPLLTCYGEGFAGRAAASILHAVGLPELIAKNLAEYEVKALRLAKDPALLGSLRNTLKQSAPKSPLFNCDRFRRHVEAAYIEMCRRRQQGESPQSFAVQIER
jgi:predicted O-linked N-acetylglucosamine transferase (SPINDLY family)